MTRISAFFMGRPADQLPLLEDLNASASKPGGFKPFIRKRDPNQEIVSSLADLVATIREATERQSQRQEELLTYLRPLPKAMEMMPELSRQQVEALGVVRQHLENQGPQGRQLASVLDKVGLAAIDQRRVLDAMRERLGMLAEHDKQAADHFSNFAAAITSSSDTTRMAGEILSALNTDIRKRDEALERILKIHQGRHTLILLGAVTLSAMALVAAGVCIYVVGIRF